MTILSLTAKNRYPSFAGTESGTELASYLKRQCRGIVIGMGTLFEKLTQYSSRKSGYECIVWCWCHLAMRPLTGAGIKPAVAFVGFDANVMLSCHSQVLRSVLYRYEYLLIMGVTVPIIAYLLWEPCELRKHQAQHSTRTNS